MTSAALTALAIGIALASAPGPVQAVLVTEAARGGMGRGLRALAGVHLTFGAMLVCLALGVSVAVPRGLGLGVLKVAGGVLLLWLAVDSLRARGQAEQVAGHRRTLPPSVRGVLAIVLNPGGWLFVAAVASPLFATAAERGGTTSALVAAGMLVAGAALGDLGAGPGRQPRPPLRRRAGGVVVSCRAGRGACRAGGMAAAQQGAPAGLSGSGRTVHHQRRRVEPGTGAGKEETMGAAVRSGHLDLGGCRR
jgi:threonine/homoserine/homoserine lactone efflux protein